MSLKEHLMASAERELGAFMRAVSELFGREHARRAADDWLDEFERMDTLPETRRDFGAITIAAAVRLATWLNADGGYPTRCALDTAADEIAEPLRPSMRASNRSCLATTTIFSSGSGKKES